jgi:cation-transporting ATPase E
LTAAEVEERRARGEVNRPPPPTNRTYSEIVQDNLFSFINNVFFVLAATLIALGRVSDALVSGLTVMLNVVVGVVQEIRAKRQLDQIALLSRPTARVIRAEGEQVVAPDAIVLGDLLCVAPGDQILVDGAVVGPATFEVDESQLTGESDLVRKQAGDLVYSGSYCVSGSGHYLAQLVGLDSFAGRVIAGARARKRTLTPLQQQINTIIRTLLLIAIYLMFVVATNALIFERNFGVMVGSLVVVLGLVPQGLLVSVIVAYSLGAMRMAGKGALVQQTNAIESLSNVDTFCMDKTGTLTTNRLKLEKLHTLGLPSGELERLLGIFAASGSSQNKTTEALRAALNGTAVTPKEEIPFSSTRKWRAQLFDDAAIRGVYVLGAPEMLRSFLRGGPDFQLQQRAWSEAGLRVLLFAREEKPRPLATADGIPMSFQQLTAIGLVAISDELRPEARETIAAFQEAGVQLKVISGDSAETVKALAVQAGFPVDAQLISGPELDAMDEAQFHQAALECSIFGRITPEQKQRLVEALRFHGRYVAMTGDGVNDVLSLKMANLGIAMQSGSQATQGVADIILLNDSFAALPRGIREGQRIINGMQDMLRLYITRDVFLALLIIAILSFNGFPFTPRQASLLALLAAGIPSFFLTAWAQPGRVERRDSQWSMIRFAVPAGFLIAVFGVFLFVAANIDAYRMMIQPAATVQQIEAAFDLHRHHGQSLLVSYLALCSLLLIVFVEPPTRWLAGGDAYSGDWRSVILTGWLFVMLAVSVLWPPAAAFWDVSPLRWRDFGIVLLFGFLWATTAWLFWRFGLFDRFFGVHRSAKALDGLVGKLRA